MDDHEFSLPRTSLAQALAALPLETPDRSAWPALAARLGKRRRAPRWPMALAAGLLALALLPRGWYSDPSAAEASPAQATTTTTPMGQSRAQLALLMSESARLERLVSAASDDGASSGSAAALSLALEDKLAAIDAELESGPEATTQLSLWQQRVELMRNIAAVETSRHYLAAEGSNLDVALVAAY